MSSARTLRGLLADHGISQLDLAGYLGISQQAMSDRLTGRTHWRIDELVRVADLLDMSLDELAPLALAAAPRRRQLIAS